MALVLSTVALAHLPVAGAGSAMLIAPRSHRFAPAELAALSLLLGFGVVPLLLLAGGLALGGLPLRVFVSAGCVALLAFGWRKRNRGNSRTTSPGGWHRAELVEAALTALLLVSTAALAFHVARRTPLGWDGAVVWESKARFWFLHEGRFPWPSFSDSTRQWIHPRYPPLVPLDELWVFLWNGRVDQRVLAPLFALELTAAVALLFHAARRLTGRLAIAPLLAAAVPFVPPVLDGCVSGYADVLLGTTWFAAVWFLAEHLDGGNEAPFRFASAAAALLPWIKLDSAVLLAAFALVALLFLPRKRKGRRLVGLLGPSIASFSAWQMLLLLARTPPEAAFGVLSPAALLGNVPRLPAVWTAILAEAGRVPVWGHLWLIGLVGGGLGLLFGPRRRCTGLFGLAVLLPMAGYSFVYLFSRWEPFLDHVTSSVPRLLLHVALPALFLAAMPLARRLPSAGKSEDQETDSRPPIFRRARAEEGSAMRPAAS